MVTGELGCRVPRHEPVGEALVQLRAHALRHLCVRGVADECMPEAEAVLVGEPGMLGPDELLAREGEERRGDV